MCCTTNEPATAPGYVVYRICPEWKALVRAVRQGSNAAMAETTFDVIVVGVGAMGAATCWELSKRGLSVLGIEQFAPGHDRGSSHGHTRVIRKAYFEDPRYVPLLHSTYDHWRTIESECEESLMVPAGCINIGPADHPAIIGVLQSVGEHNLPHDKLHADEIQHRFPAFRCDAGDIGVYERDAGFLRPERCIAAMMAQAQKRGTVIRSGERVMRWRAEINGVSVETDRSKYSARSLVITAGPWLPIVCADLGLPLRVERQVQTWYTPTVPANFAVGRLPSFIHFTSDRAYYGIPIDNAAPAPFDRAVKIARHHGGEISTADAVRRDVSADDEADVRGYIRRHMPDANGPLAGAKVCLYTNTPDENFIIDRHPDHANVWLAGGFSGHGFKFAPVVGEILADFVTNGHTAHPVGLFSIARFCPRT